MAFGQLAARHLAPRMRLLVQDPAWPPGSTTGVESVTLANLVEVARCAIVILAVPGSELERTVNAIEPQAAGRKPRPLGPLQAGRHGSR
jgi:hypothetical protein